MDSGYLVRNKNNCLAKQAVEMIPLLLVENGMYGFRLEGFFLLAECFLVLLSLEHFRHCGAVARFQNLFFFF